MMWIVGYGVNLSALLSNRLKLTPDVNWSVADANH